MSQPNLTSLPKAQTVVGEVFQLAFLVRRRGKTRSLRDTTILFPIDSLLIESVSMALEKIAQGSLGDVQLEVEEFLQPVWKDPHKLQQFEIALKALRDRLSS